MATRYTVTVTREEYIPASDHVTGRARYEIADYGLLREALDAIEIQCERWGWFIDRETDRE